MMKLVIRFKAPDMIHDYICQQVPGDSDDPKIEKRREKLSKDMFEWGDYGVAEIDTESGTGRLVPRREW